MIGKRMDNREIQTPVRKGGRGILLKGESSCGIQATGRATG